MAYYITEITMIAMTWYNAVAVVVLSLIHI